MRSSHWVAIIAEVHRHIGACFVIGRPEKNDTKTLQRTARMVAVGNERVTETLLNTVDLHGFDHIHLTVDAAAAIGLIDGIARIFFGQLIDVLTRTMSLVAKFANMSLNFDPMIRILWIDHQQGKFAVDLQVAGFLGCGWCVYPNMLAIKIAPHWENMWLSIRGDGRLGIQKRAAAEIVEFFL